MISLAKKTELETTKLNFNEERWLLNGGEVMAAVICRWCHKDSMVCCS